MHDHTDPPPDGRSAYERLGHDESPLFSRRSFLRTSAFALAGATMAACTGGGRKQPVVAPTATASVVATDTRWAPWRAIDANDKRSARVAALTAIADSFAKAMPAEPPATGDTVVAFPSQRSA